MSVPPPLAELGSWIQLAVTVTRIRVHRSRFGYTTVRHDFTDDSGRAIMCWHTAELGETGDRGSLFGQVVGYEEEFGRPLWKMADVRFRAWDEDEAAFEDRLSNLLDDARRGVTGDALGPADGAKRRRDDVRRNDLPPTPTPTEPVDDLAWTKRFQRLDPED